MNKFRDVINYLCATGEWEIENPNDFWETSERLKRKDNFKLYLRVEKDRLSIAASSASTKITISLAKPVEVIVKEIDKRIVVPTQEAWQQSLIKKEKERLEEEEHKRIVQRLCKVAEADLPRFGKHTFYGGKYSTGVSLHKCQVNTDTCELSFWFVPFDLAEKIIKLAKGESNDE